MKHLRQLFQKPSNSFLWWSEDTWLKKWKKPLRRGNKSQSVCSKRSRTVLNKKCKLSRRRKPALKRKCIRSAPKLSLYSLEPSAWRLSGSMRMPGYLSQVFNKLPVLLQRNGHNSLIKKRKSSMSKQEKCRKDKKSEKPGLTLFSIMSYFRWPKLKCSNKGKKNDWKNWVLKWKMRNIKKKDWKIKKSHLKLKEMMYKMWNINQILSRWGMFKVLRKLRMPNSSKLLSKLSNQKLLRMSIQKLLKMLLRLPKFNTYLKKKDKIKGIMSNNLV